MIVIDVNTSVGRRVAPDPRYAPSALADEMDRHEVACALCYAQQAVHYDPRAGNEEALALARADGRFLPALVLDPRDTPGWERELARATAGGVCAVRIFPGEQRWSVW